MKIFLNLCCVLSTVSLISLAASQLGYLPSIQAKTGESWEGKISARETLTFSPHVRSKVAQYFDTYRTEIHGLPPGCVDARSVGEVPLMWSQSWLPIGTSIEETDRSALIKLPIELERVLAANSVDNIHYYLAGKNLVALDSRFRLVDSILIPTIKLGQNPRPNAEKEVLQLVNHTIR